MKIIYYKDDIEKHFDKISEILIDCRKLTYDSYYMCVTKTNTKHIIISREKFLKRVRESFWTLAIIELTKLYSKNNRNDHFSIPFLIKKLLNSSFSELISSDKLKELEINFTIPNIKTRIDKLKELRNQHFAHTDIDPDNNIYDIEFYFDDSIFLIEKAEKIIEFLSLKILSKPIVFSKYEGEEMESFFDKHKEYIDLAGRYNLEKN